MIADHESFAASPEHLDAPREPAWQSVAGCLVLLLSLALLWLVL